ncbi:MAG: hypothetical protein HW388_25 [Dehalococcoidia bacterium]|nr:hypothetical protein [Dehalococcoidia bacterium]
MSKLLALRPYQVEIGRAVLDSVLHHKGLTFSVEIARQGGKNELSAQLEVLLLTLFTVKGGNLVKGAPTFDPQVRISMARLKERLNDAGMAGLWSTEAGHILGLGRGRQMFLSAEPSTNVVGATAHILLEMDEAQDVDREKFYREFRPMGASTNVTTVLYGTPWKGDTLLEEVKQANLEMERADGIKRHFHLDWEEVARYNPLYRAYVEGERQRLGESHPLFRTQYLLEPLHGGGGLFSPQQRAQMQGDHSRRSSPEQGKVYVAAVDIAGEAEEGKDEALRIAQPQRDSTVVTIGELDFSHCDQLMPEPAIRIVEHCWWTGQSHASLFPRLVDVLRGLWRCRRVVVDATGLGQGIASFLEKTLGRAVVEPFTFTVQSKSRLAFDLLATVNSGRLKMYARDGSPEFQELWSQVEKAQGYFRANQTMSFHVPPAMGHDDFLMSLALLVRAAAYQPRAARGRVPA